MAARKKLPEESAMAADDPRLPLKVNRLREARGNIAAMLAREPRLEDPEYEEWETRVQELLREVFGSSGYFLRFRQLNIRPIMYQMGGRRWWHGDANQAWQTGLSQAERLLEDAVEEAELVSGTKTSGASPVASRAHSNRVFVVHGHDDAARETAARFLEQLEVQAIILHEKANEGRTVIEKLEHYADVDFAVILLTPDDVGAPQAEQDKLRARARQNVILELGYFVGRLGRKSVCALYKGELELPSDYVGVTYVSFDSAGGWRLQLAKELKSSGFDIDMNRAL